MSSETSGKEWNIENCSDETAGTAEDTVCGRNNDYKMSSGIAEKEMEGKNCSDTEAGIAENTVCGRNGNKLRVGIVGLGLIGGSFTKAYAEKGHEVLAYDIDRSILDFAKIGGFVSEELTKENISTCDLVLICVYPGAAVESISETGPFIGKKPLVMDCCGTKRAVFEPLRVLSDQYGFTYAGAHPMAGTQYSGFKYAKADMFCGAPMVIVLKDHNDILLLDRISRLLAPCGFRKISSTTAEAHDRIIAFTSQLAHVVSSAYVKSPTAQMHEGFSAGSYKDMTRVAWLNPDMWTELFLDNGDYLCEELDILIETLVKYRDAIRGEDRDGLRELLHEGALLKKELDG